ncbi:MAG: hypothetical protein ACLUT5_12730 [Butyricicoccus sp.]
MKRICLHSTAWWTWDTTINGSVKNIELAADEIPRLSTIGGAS